MKNDGNLRREAILGVSRAIIQALESCARLASVYDSFSEEEKKCTDDEIASDFEGLFWADYHYERRILVGLLLDDIYAFGGRPDLEREFPKYFPPETPQGTMSARSTYNCRFCHCSERMPCETDDGPCYWLVQPTKRRAGVCSAPKCATAFRREKIAARREAKASATRVG